MSSLEISKSLLAHLELQPPPRETILQELAELELVRLWTFDVAEEALSGDEQETREEARALLKRIHTVIGHRVAKKRFRAADLFWRCLIVQHKLVALGPDASQEAYASVYEPFYNIQEALPYALSATTKDKNALNTHLRMFRENASEIAATSYEQLREDEVPVRSLMTKWVKTVAPLCSLMEEYPTQLFEPGAKQAIPLAPTPNPPSIEKRAFPVAAVSSPSRKRTREASGALDTTVPVHSSRRTQSPRSASPKASQPSTRKSPAAPAAGSPVAVATLAAPLAEQNAMETEDMDEDNYDQVFAEFVDSDVDSVAEARNPGTSAIQRENSAPAAQHSPMQVDWPSTQPPQKSMGGSVMVDKLRQASMQNQKKLEDDAAKQRSLNKEKRKAEAAAAKAAQKEKKAKEAAAAAAAEAVAREEKAAAERAAADKAAADKAAAEQARLQREQDEREREAEAAASRTFTEDLPAFQVPKEQPPPIAATATDQGSSAPLTSSGSTPFSSLHATAAANLLPRPNQAQSRASQPSTSSASVSSRPQSQSLVSTQSEGIPKSTGEGLLSANYDSDDSEDGESMARARVLAMDVDDRESSLPLSQGASPRSTRSFVDLDDDATSELEDGDVMMEISAGIASSDAGEDDYKTAATVVTQAAVPTPAVDSSASHELREDVKYQDSLAEDEEYVEDYGQEEGSSIDPDPL